MEQKHTPGPWKVTGTGTIRYIDAPAGNGIMQEVAACMRVEYGDMDANARRIVACVNACEGLSTDLLERFGLASAFGTELLEMEKQRDQLLEALEGMVNMYTAFVNSGDAGHWNPESDKEVITARAAIATAKEQK